MLTYEWRELEELCERISDLRHRYSAAQRTQNAGLLEGLDSQLARAMRQRTLLVHHITASLGSAAAGEVVQAESRPEPEFAATPPIRAGANRTLYCFAI